MFVTAPWWVATKTSVKLIKALAKNVTGPATAPYLGLLITEQQERLKQHLLALLRGTATRKCLHGWTWRSAVGRDREEEANSLLGSESPSFPQSNKNEAVYNHTGTAVSSCVWWEETSWWCEVSCRIRSVLLRHNHDFYALEGRGKW